MDNFLMNYMYYLSIRQFYDFKNFFNFYPFHYNLADCLNYIIMLYDFKFFYNKKINELFLKRHYLRKNFNPSLLKKKKTRNKLLRSAIQLLKGYKFEFKGRFSRKQRASHV
jgi:hypothetical protein